MTTPDPFVPWWRPPFRAGADFRPTFANWWDALFGRLETFYRVELDGSWYVCEHVEDVTGDDSEPYPYVITDGRMTRRQYENLPEFTGF